MKAPTPPFQALTKAGSASSDTGLKEPVAKYGPTGHTMTKIMACLAKDTPSDGWRVGVDGGVRGQGIRQDKEEVGGAYLDPNEGGSDVEAGVQ